MNLAVLLWLLLSAIMLTAHGNKPGGKINIQVDEAAAEPGEAEKTTGNATARKNDRSAVAKRQNDEEEKWRRVEGPDGPSNGKPLMVLRQPLSVQRLTTITKSFFVVKWNLLDWNRSRAACQARGADLAIVQTKEEQTLLLEYLVSLVKQGGFGDQLWVTLGAKKEDSNMMCPKFDRWRWIDGSSFTCADPFKWSSNPSFGKTCERSNEGCGLFLTVTKSGKNEGFLGCSTAYPLCESTNEL